MPLYRYVCQACATTTEVRATVAAYSQGLQPRCPACESDKLIRTFTPVGLMKGGTRGGPACGPNAGPGCCGG